MNRPIVGVVNQSRKQVNCTLERNVAHRVVGDVSGEYILKSISTYVCTSYRDRGR